MFNPAFVGHAHANRCDRVSDKSRARECNTVIADGSVHLIRVDGACVCHVTVCSFGAYDICGIQKAARTTVIPTTMCIMFKVYAYNIRKSPKTDFVMTALQENNFYGKFMGFIVIENKPFWYYINIRMYAYTRTYKCVLLMRVFRFNMPRRSKMFLLWDCWRKRNFIIRRDLLSPCSL
jgi:hypothetical protein